MTDDIHYGDRMSERVKELEEELLDRDRRILKLESVLRLSNSNTRRRGEKVKTLRAALEAFCDYVEAARLPSPPLNQLAAQGRRALSSTAPGGLPSETHSTDEGDS